MSGHRDHVHGIMQVKFKVLGSFECTGLRHESVICAQTHKTVHKQTKVETLYPLGGSNKLPWSKYLLPITLHDVYYNLYFI